MISTYRVIPTIKRHQRLIIHPETAQKLRMVFRRIGFVRYGLRVVDVEVVQTEEIGRGEIGLPISCIEQLSLPVSCSFELRALGNELQIGPYIGILAAHSKERLAEVVDQLSNTVYDYPSIGGAVLALAADSFDQAKQEAHGYLYNPETDEWEAGTYGYPACLFKRTGVSTALRTHLQTVLGGRVFNDYMFDKWEMHRWLSQFSALIPHLPDTRLYGEFRDLAQMLTRHGSLIIKPVRGSQGLGVVQVRPVEGGYQVRAVQDGAVQELVRGSLSELEGYFEGSNAARGCLLQQAVELLEVDQQKIDFRSLVVKEGTGRWRSMAVIARMGVKGSIVSNVSRGGRAELAQHTLKNRLGLSDDQVFAAIQEMERVSLLAARGIEESGVHAGNFGLDLAFDRDHRLWILEINNIDPNHTIAIDAGQRQLFYEIKRANLLYAKRLAGFGEEEDR